MKTKRIKRNKRIPCKKYGHDYQEGYTCVNCDKVHHKKRIRYQRDVTLLESIKEDS